jgi:hypothetical protein
LRSYKKENEAAELKVLAGENLIVRDLPVKLESDSISIPQFTVLFPSTGLGVLTIELDAAVLINSREYFINSDKRPQLGFDPGSITFAVTMTSITISLPTAVTADIGVWVQVYKTGSNLVPQTLTSVIKQNDKSTTISVQLSSGSYQFLTSVAGYKPIIYERTV